MESAVAGGVDKQFHVDKVEMKTVKAKRSKIRAGEIIKIKWRGEGDLRVTRRRLRFTFSGVEGFWQSVPRESPCWTGVRSKDGLDSVFLGDLDTNTRTLQQKSFALKMRDPNGSNEVRSPEKWKPLTRLYSL